MIISLTSPRKGQGQTIAGITLGAYFAKMMNQDVCLVDTNKIYSDMDTYLSDACVSRGLDGFNSSNVDFKRDCTRKIKENLYLSVSSPVTCLHNGQISDLIEVLKMNFRHVIIDANIGNECRTYLDNSDVIFIVIKQSKQSVHSLKEHQAIYRPYLDKISFIVNECFTSINGSWVNYDRTSISRDLEELGFTCPVFTLPFSPGLLNEINNQSLLHFMHEGSDYQYLGALNTLTGCLFDSVTFQKYFNRNKKLEKITAFNKLLAGGSL